MRAPWTARRSNQSILKEINPEYSLEGLMLKLKLQYFGHLRQRADSLEKTLMLGKIEGRRRRGQQRMITDSMGINLSKLREAVKDREAWHAASTGLQSSDTNEQLNNNNKSALHSSHVFRAQWNHLPSPPSPQPGSPWAAWTVLGPYID